VIVTGGDPQNIGRTEADLMGVELIKLGVSPEDILGEDKARHTIENAVFVCKYIIESTMPSVTDIHLVSIHIPFCIPFTWKRKSPSI
jgi:hypothetical protein